MAVTARRPNSVRPSTGLLDREARLGLTGLRHHRRKQGLALECLRLDAVGKVDLEPHQPIVLGGPGRHGAVDVLGPLYENVPQLAAARERSLENEPRFIASKRRPD